MSAKKSPQKTTSTQVALADSINNLVISIETLNQSLEAIISRLDNKSSSPWLGHEFSRSLSVPDTTALAIALAATADDNQNSPPNSVSGIQENDTIALKQKYHGIKQKKTAVSASDIDNRTTALLWWKFTYNADLYPTDREFPDRIKSALSALRYTINNDYFDDVQCNIKEPNLTNATTFAKLTSAISRAIKAIHKLP